MKWLSWHSLLPPSKPHIHCMIPQCPEAITLLPLVFGIPTHLNQSKYLQDSKNSVSVLPRFYNNIRKLQMLQTYNFKILLPVNSEASFTFTCAKQLGKYGKKWICITKNYYKYSKCLQIIFTVATNSSLYNLLSLTMAYKNVNSKVSPDYLYIKF